MDSLVVYFCVVLFIFIKMVEKVNERKEYLYSIPASIFFPILYFCNDINSSQKTTELNKPLLSFALIELVFFILRPFKEFFLPVGIVLFIVYFIFTYNLYSMKKTEKGQFKFEYLRDMMLASVIVIIQYISI